MRFFLRRLTFYVFAVWVALTLNFLLPRLMPGSPIGGGVITYLVNAKQYVGVATGMGSKTWQTTAGNAKVVVYGLP